MDVRKASSTSAAPHAFPSQGPKSSSDKKTMSPLVESILTLPPLSPKPLRERASSDPEGATTEMTAQVGEAVFQGTVRMPQATVTTEVAVPSAKKAEPKNSDQIVMVAAKEFDPKNYKECLSGKKMELNFSTAALPGEGVARSIDFQKKEDKEYVADTEREEKATVQFAKVKFLTGTGGREGSKNVPVEYSISHHFLVVQHETGPQVYDLLDKGDIKHLLEKQGMDASDENINKVFNELREVNKEMRKLVETEAGVQKDCFATDYVGNPNGYAFHQNVSDRMGKMITSKRRGRDTKNMRRLGLIHEPSRFSKDKLTPQGAKALNNVEKLRYLNANMAKKLETLRIKQAEVVEELKGKDQTQETAQKLKAAQSELNEIDHALKQVMQAQSSEVQGSIERNLLELEGMHKTSLPAWNGETFAETHLSGWELLEPSEKTINRFLSPAQRPGGTNEVGAEGRAKIRTQLQQGFLMEVAQNRNQTILEKKQLIEYVYNRRKDTNLAEKTMAIGEAMALLHMSQHSADPSRGIATERLEKLKANQALNHGALARKDMRTGAHRGTESLGSTTFQEATAARFMMQAFRGIVLEGKEPSEVATSFSQYPTSVQKALTQSLEDLRKFDSRLDAHHGEIENPQKEIEMQDMSWNH